MAIILAGFNSNIELLGISTAAGNQTVEKTTLNALKMLTVCNLEHIDVVAGQTKAICRPVKRYNDSIAENDLAVQKFMVPQVWMEQR